MKIINFLSIILISFVFVQCSRAVYLPDHKTLDRNPYGSFIRVITFNYKYYTGELISANEKELKLLSDKNDLKEIITIQKKEIDRYYLIYAKNPATPWLYILPFFHGFFFIFTFIPNAVITNNVDFTYTARTLKYEDLKMFARFPAGIPPEIPENTIK